ncbi:MAG: hypothetical protein IPL26_18755 [Leptospiraceae bacterium]|nr:hypothetical protein [Leptospiraceae bacterium]
MKYIYKIGFCDMYKVFIECFHESSFYNNDGNHKTEKNLTARYKFLKGKLYKEAAKDKWEEVKSESGD